MQSNKKELMPNQKCPVIVKSNRNNADIANIVKKLKLLKLA